MLKFHTGHDNELSLRHYPPISAKIVEKQEMRRLSSHYDFDAFTLLFQDDCGGLEVEKKGCPGEYVSVDPIEGALVMNIGDALQRWSNGEQAGSGFAFEFGLIEEQTISRQQSIEYISRHSRIDTQGKRG